MTSNQFPWHSQTHDNSVRPGRKTKWAALNYTQKQTLNQTLVISHFPRTWGTILRLEGTLRRVIAHTSHFQHVMTNNLNKQVK